MFIKIKKFKNIHMIILKGYGGLGEKGQDDVTTIQHLVTYTMMVDTNVKNKI